MQKFLTFVFKPRTLVVIGALALLLFLFIGADAFGLNEVWVAAALALGLLAWGIFRVVRWRRGVGSAGGLEQSVKTNADRAAKHAGSDEKRTEILALRNRMLEAIKTLKKSRLGEASGAGALYELPWYMVIGNPAAGKSSAIAKSGLRFPFADQSGVAVNGIGGTRNCDWFFTTEGILLDTAGRYSVYEEDRQEWFGFLTQLKKFRSKAPINGIIIAVSLTELMGKKPEATIQLAKQLRQRVQELTERLEVIAPVYLLFTKADLISGFAEFFEDRDRTERDQVWGATFAYAKHERADALVQFDTHFNELFEGLKAASVSRMSMHRGQELPPGVLTFPLEFASLRTPLRTFLSTLFEENPYQFRPVFRGFYFSSAVQEGRSSSRSGERIAQRFGLQLRDVTTAQVFSGEGFFLKNLFSKVIFADRDLVKQYASRTKTRLRMLSFGAGALALAICLAGWSWSYVGNRQWVHSVQADLDKAVKLQAGRTDLQSRLEALDLIRDRLAQLDAYKQDRPWAVSLGLYQGAHIEAALQREFSAGVREIMFKPTAAAIEEYLKEVNAGAAALVPAAVPLPASGFALAASSPSPAASASPVLATTRPDDTPAHYTSASASNVTDAYNALKTYIMLSDRSRVEAPHMSDQVTRFWRGWLESNRGAMPREQLLRHAERLISFTVQQSEWMDFPQLQTNVALVEETRENLRRVVKGMAARERVYGEIRARAATRFPPLTIARIVGEQDKLIVAGSYAISGAYTHAAWQGYVADAIKEAAYKELQTEDWVLKVSARDDLSLEGSPEQIQKALVGMYKADYIREWQKFIQGISVHEFGGFEQAVERMNRLGDASQSPLGKIVQTLYEETSWDSSALADGLMAKAKTGVTDWFKNLLRGGAPAEVNVDLASIGGGIAMGPVAKEFAPLSRLTMSRDNAPTLMKTYLEALSKVRSRFNQIKAQGDPGPASRLFAQQTLDGTGSELAEALRLVDEQMLNGMGDGTRASFRPFLVRPLLQAFQVLMPPAEAEINRIWTAKVVEPYQRELSGKYPFAKDAKVEAGAGEIGRIFGAEGAIAKFADQGLGTLVTRRGDVITARTWGDIGIRLKPEFTDGFRNWVLPLEAQGTGGGAGSAEGQTVFQVLPQPTSGLTEYTIEIDGQVLRYRNTSASWVNFVWPSPQGTPGVRITGVTFDGRAVEFANFPGRFGLEKMINSAKRQKLDAGLFEFRWANGNLSVPVHLRIISAPGGGGAAAGSKGAGSLRGLVLPPLVVGPTPLAVAAGPRP